MKKIILGSLAIVFAVVLVSFTNKAENSAKFACTWFVFDDNSSTNPGATGNGNGVPTASEALDQLNFKEVTEGTASTLCPQTDQLCAICVETTTLVNNVKRPVILSTTIENKIRQYYGQFVPTLPAQDPAVVDFPGVIKEKLAF